ncbi:MAG TPA: nidogen-like domain-containing protein [Flavobacteriales bacterium]|nr:nidogen-like domain-containing protein [Flavobacteriales bacterium]
MKQYFSLVCLALTSLLATSQSTETHYFNSADYSKMKASGTLPAGNVIELLDPATKYEVIKKEGEFAPETRAGERAGGCGCYIPADASYTLAMGPNDDGSTGVIALPFTFCLYGTNYTSLYINNNGNVSFGTSYGTYSASGFPSAGFVMVAPFWADVDTRPDATHGTVKYKIYPNAIYVNWEGVGYYSMMADKLNTFSLILSDGTDTTIGVGNNVAFCYQDMQWTTGAASSGVGGFGGVPATVGANKGDGTSYLQFGRFDHAGTDYDGPVATTDGISWLDYQSFKFSTCVTTSNVEPVFIDFSPDLANLSFDCGTGDTIKVCATGDTLIMSAQVFDANVSDVVTMSLASTSPYTIISNTPGNPATISWSFVATAASAGFNTFTVTATDNGVPALSANATVQIFVDTTGTGAFTTTIGGDTLICPGETTTLNVPAIFDTYEWIDGSNTETSGSITAEGDYWVTLSNNSCYKTISQHVYELTPPEPVALGNMSLCMTPTTTLNSQDPWVTYNWTLNGGFVSNADTAFITAPGTVVLTVTDTNGCIGDSAYTIVSGPTLDVTGPSFICSAVGTINLLATPNVGGGTFLWNTGDTDSLQNCSVTGMYVCTYTDLTGCVASDSQFVDVATSPDIYISTTDSIGCSGETLTLTVAGITGGGSILWSTGATTTSISVTSGTSYSVTVDNSGCIDTDNIPVIFSNPAVNITGPSSVCSPGTINLVATATLPGSYSWSNGDLDSIANAATTGSYTVTFTDQYGCTATDMQAVTIITTPNITITTSDSVVCVGDVITLTVSGVTGGGAITWTPGGATTSSITVTSGTSASVSVNNSGCIDSDFIPLVFNANPVVNITGLTSTCANVPISITANITSGSGSILWSTGDATASITPTSTGTYSVTVTDGNGCEGTDAQLITIYPVPVASFTFAPPSPYSPPSIPVDIDYSSTSTISSGSIVGYQWNINDTAAGNTSDITHTYNHYGLNNVTLVVVSDHGCVDSISQPYEVAPVLLIPNIFTPSSSPGYNDMFEVQSLWYFSPATLKVFDRWGVLVFQSDNYQNTWDGTKDGNPVAEGVYYYELILNDGRVFPGYVHVARTE